jgi:hypothetical protein
MLCALLMLCPPPPRLPWGVPCNVVRVRETCEQCHCQYEGFIKGLKGPTPCAPDPGPDDEQGEGRRGARGRAPGRGGRGPARGRASERGARRPAPRCRRTTRALARVMWRASYFLIGQRRPHQADRSTPRAEGAQCTVTHYNGLQTRRPRPRRQTSVSLGDSSPRGHSGTRSLAAPAARPSGGHLQIACCSSVL